MASMDTYEYGDDDLQDRDDSMPVNFAQPATDNENDDEERNLDDWVVRGSAQRILAHRQSLLPPKSRHYLVPHVKAPTGGRPGGGGGGKRPSSLENLPLVTSDAFQIDDSIDFVRNHKMDVVHEAFKAAASTVLRAILQQKAREQDDTAERDTSDEDEDEDDEKDGLDQPIPNLPESLNDRQRIAALRQAALTRGLENKEWAKRRMTKTQPSTTTVDGTAAEGTDGASTKRGGGRKRKSDAITQDPAEGGDTASNTESGGPSAQPKVDTANSSSTTSAVVPSSGPKFTRNTPASSAAALDHRFTNSRAILCAAGNLVMAALTPELEGHELEPNDVPQKRKHASINLAAVLVDANVYARRAITIVENAVKRSDMRNKYRKENARYSYKNTFYQNNEPDKFFVRLPNLFAWKEDSETSSVWSGYMFEGEDVVPHRPNEASLTDAWQSFCLPRFRSIIRKGSGHVLYHDIQWFSRHGRLANLLKTLKRPGGVDYETGGQLKDEPSFGPHLIVTTQPETTKFAQEFLDMRSHCPLVFDRRDIEEHQLRVLVFDGTKEERRKLRRRFSEASGVAEAPFHVVVVSYSIFLEDYLHFCQVPFEVIILDEGASWMAASHGDPNSSLATVWEQGIWSRRQHAGVAGAIVVADPWDFTADEIPESAMKDACIGLTARHRIMTASHLVAENKSSIELLPISAVVSFLSPFFSSVVQEEWDRSNIAKDADSMQHFRKLVARSMVIHHESSPLRDMHEMALLGLEGQMGFTERFGDPITPEFITDDDFVAAEKVTFSRRACLSWLGTKSVDWLRYELGSSNFQHILDAMKVSTKHGHFCEEITTASSTTSSGATGQVGGTMAYRLAVCCLRHFGSEQGLRQHISAQHAPPGTWLCRTCGIDCITSQARTHHERTCGQPTNGSTGDPTGSVGATPTVGQGGAKGGVGKKKSQRSVTTHQGAAAQEEKDPNGALRVPGYRGVWVNKEGKHFIKVDRKRFTGEGDDVVLFDSNDAAARMYDEIITKSAEGKQTLELNFKPDGTRNIYEDATSSTASGLGGSAANVVPLLSVINIKDLPPDVKPLLRDPRQTSRTGGNSKRHVYAYRGVCRQARKGHDRWQSQISFMGVNHYLGTFDSEWDAAAIYAWAHLILYGEEATKQAQKEGEEAAEAYEQEKRDLAAGKLPAEPPKPEKSKKQARKKSEQTKGAKKGKSSKPESSNQKEDKSEGVKKRKVKPKDTPEADKKAKVELKNAKSEKEAMNATLALGVVKTPVFGEREVLEGLELAELESKAASRIRTARGMSYCVGDFDFAPSPATTSARPCLPFTDSRGSNTLGAAVLVGLPHDIGWNLDDFVASNVDERFVGTNAADILAGEYDDDGINENFKTCIQGSVCLLGRATNRVIRLCSELLGITVAPGQGVGNIDCHVGGHYGTCSGRASCIRYAVGEFQLCCLSDRDVVTLNGHRISADMGWVGLEHNDICSVGPRVFMFILPS
ncbi:hypothetical protein ACA910_012812 [Epithemia clementina (nom. ined.)]